MGEPYKVGDPVQKEIPPSILVGETVKNSIEEINAMMYLIENPSGKMVSRYKLPNHMRRRAMSHDIRRVPYRLRETYLSLREKSNTREGKTKVPRKKYRRRPKQLAKEYNRRQKIYSWLETHIWHAKRFAMVPKWGYKIPLKPADKSYRACYRATANHCLIQDISYFSCIEINGKLDDILTGLECHINKETNLHDIKTLSDGSKEGTAFFYCRNLYPKGAIGELNFIWKASDDPNKERRSIWLWVHPSFVELIFNELSVTFNLQLLEEDVDMEVEQLTEFEKIPPKNRTISKYINKEQQIEMCFLNLNRFRLIGPLSQAILSKALIPVQLIGRTTVDWVSEFYDSENKVKALESQNSFWTKMKCFTSPAQMTPRIVAPLTVYDPRFTMPPYKIKTVNDEDNLTFEDVELKSELLINPMFCKDWLKRITKEKLSTKQVNDLRSNKLVPGMGAEENNIKNINSQAFPILAIQSPGNQLAGKRLGFGCGWDIICPAGFAMPLWLCLIMNGARAGGLREYESHLREAGLLSPYPPDTIAGQNEEKVRKTQAADKYFRLPPAKRHNYIKLGIPTPFHCPWDILIKDWTQSSEFYILRTRSILRKLDQGLDSGVLPDIPFPPDALLGVSVRCDGKGLLEANAHICMPTELDLSTKIPPVEPKQMDGLKETRENSVKAHQQFLRFLSRKRKKQRINKKEGETIEAGKFTSQTAISEQKEKMKNLWLPECDSIRNHCSREIFGFVSDGDFCFTDATSSGVGYVTLEGFKQLVKLNTKRTVLIRTTNTLQYRFAKIKVVIN